ncbi:MAG: hypothetical protein FWG36_02075 [Oscillospiraceae bacterium]|nr:hypothetical protein [Oscillospiraceae bacterium]
MNGRRLSAEELRVKLNLPQTTQTPLRTRGNEIVGRNAPGAPFFGNDGASRIPHLPRREMMPLELPKMPRAVVPTEDECRKTKKSKELALPDLPKANHSSIIPAKRKTEIQPYTVGRNAPGAPFLNAGDTSGTRDGVLGNDGASRMPRPTEAAFHQNTPEMAENNRRQQEEWESSPFSKMPQIDAAIKYKKLSKQDKEKLPEYVRYRLDMIYADEIKNNDIYLRHSGGSTIPAAATKAMAVATLGLPELALKKTGKDYHAKQLELARLQSPVASAIGGVAGAMLPTGMPAVISKGVAKAAGPLVAKAASPLGKALGNIATGGAGAFNRAGISEMARHPIRTALTKGAYEAALRGSTSAVAGGIIGGAEEIIGGGSPEEVLKSARDRAVTYGLFGAAGGALSGGYQGLKMSQLSKQLRHMMKDGTIIIGNTGGYSAYNPPAASAVNSKVAEEVVQEVAEEVAGLILRSDGSLSLAGASPAAVEVLRSPYVLDAVARAAGDVSNQLTAYDAVGADGNPPEAGRLPSSPTGDGADGINGASGMPRPTEESQITEGTRAANDRPYMENASETIKTGRTGGSEALISPNIGIPQNHGIVNTEYEQSVDNRVLDMIEQIVRGGTKNVAPLNLGTINKTHADKLRELTGVDYSGYSIQLPGNTVEHITKRHGQNGIADRSMSDPKDIARIGWVIENFDDATLSGTISRIHNFDGTPAPIVILSKRVNGNYYVAEAIPDTAKKILYIQSAYKNKSSQAAVWHKPSAVTSETKPTNTLDNSIVPQTTEIVNTFSDEINHKLGGINNAERLTTPGTAPIPAADVQHAAGDISRRDGRWDDGASIGGQTGILAERSRGNQERHIQAERARDIRNAVDNLELSAATARSFGIINGTNDAALTEVPERIWDTDMINTAKRVMDETGLPVRYFSGSLWIDGAGGRRIKAQGAITPESIVIQADNLRYTPGQIADHEIFHKLAANDTGLVEAVAESILKRFTLEELEAAIREYQKKYHGAYKDNGNELLLMMEEIFADAYAGIDAFSAGATQFTDTVRGVANPPQERYSVADTADELTPPDFQTANISSRKEIAANERDSEKQLKTGLLNTFFIQPGDRARMRDELGALASRVNNNTYTEQMLHDTFNKLFHAGKVRDESGREYSAAAKALKDRKIYVSPSERAEFGDDWNGIRQRAFGHKVHFTNNSGDIALDVSNRELAELFPGLFDVRDVDPASMINNMLRVLDGAGTRTISLDEQARRYGGDEAVDAFRAQMYQEFLDTVSDYHGSIHGARADRLSAVEQAREENSNRLREYGQNVKNYIESRANRARDERLRVIPKEEFAGTLSVGGYDVKIEGALGNYGLTESLMGNYEASKTAEREAKKAERRLKPSAEEKMYAHAIVSGQTSPSDIPASLDADRIMELADYYWAERGSSDKMIRQQRAVINSDLEEFVENLVKDTDDFRPRSTLKLNYTTPERNMLKMFGEEKGEFINDNIFRPIGRNAAEITRFVNAMFDKLRRIEDASGKLRKLTKDESAYGMIAIEGMSAGRLAENMPKGKYIRLAAENIKNDAERAFGEKGLFTTEKDGRFQELVADAANEFGLDAEERRLAVKLARWMGVEDKVSNGTADGVIIKNAAEKYSGVFDDMHGVINKIRLVHGQKPIGYIRGYAPHMQPNGENLVSGTMKWLGMGDDVGYLPTPIAGLTASFKPINQWVPYFETRYGDETVFDLVGAGESYIRRAAPMIYHTDDIMRLRAFEKYMRRIHADEEIQANLEWARELRYGTPEQKQEFLRNQKIISPGTTLSPADIDGHIDRFVDEQYDRIQNNSLHGSLVQWLDNFANILAGKQTAGDRGTEAQLGREALTWGNKIVRTFSRARIAGNLSSALISGVSQFSLIIAKNPVYAARAFADIFSGKTGWLKQNEWAYDSDFLTGKHGIDFINLEQMKKVDVVLYKPMQVFDGLTARLAVRSAYLRETAAGKTHDEAMKEADRYGREAMSSRVTGEKPLGFHAKGPVWQALNLFQVEPLGQVMHVMHDLPRYFKNMAREKGRETAWREWAKYVSVFMLTAFTINRIQDELSGSSMQPFDIFGMAADIFAAGNEITANELMKVITDNGFEKLFDSRPFGTEGLNDEPFNWGKAGKKAFDNAAFEVPFLRNAMGVAGINGQSLPLPDLWGAGKNITAAWGEDGLSLPELGGALLGLGADVMPGGNQLRKTAQGIETMMRGGRYRGYGEDSRLQYPVDGTWQEALQAMMFGNSGLQETQKYWASGLSGLSKPQTALYESLVDGGAGRKEIYNAIQDWRRVGSDDSVERGEQRRDIIRALDMTDGQKLEMYSGLSGTRPERFNSLMDTGLSWDDVMDSYDMWSETNAARYKSFVSAGLTAEKSLGLTSTLAELEPLRGVSSVSPGQRYRAIDAAKLSEREKIAAIGVIMGAEMETGDGNSTQYAKMLEVIDAGLRVREYLDLREVGSVDTYLRYTDAGVDGKAALNVTLALDKLHPLDGKENVTPLQRFRAVVDALDDTAEQLDALSIPMSETEHFRLVTANSYMITPGQYVRFREVLDDIDDNGSITQDEARRAIDRMLGLNRTQKAVLWQLQNKSWSARNNPYSATVGAEIREKLQNEGGGGLQWVNLPRLGG